MTRASTLAATVCSSLLLFGCSSSTPPSPPELPDPAKAAARSLSIIHDATAEQPRVLKLLFYGQSISVPAWTDKAMATLRAKYPNVAFDVRNMALGGWDAVKLVRTASRDVDEFYPDLIVFHVYGDPDAYETMIRSFRSETAADVIVQTDHVVDPVEPLCATGIFLKWSPPPGCKGHFRFKQSNPVDYMSSFWVPTMAAKYDLALEPRRKQWNDYLQANHVEPRALIHDAPHPNERGWTLMAKLFTDWLVAQVDRAGGTRPANADQVRSLPAPRPGEGTSYEFDGNRIELLAAGPLDGKVDVTVDGKAPRDLDGCWQTSRVSRLPTITDWPAIKRVTVDPATHEAERWTITVTNLDDKQEKFDFTLSSSRGALGSGKGDQSFTSSDGRVTIEPGDWNLAYARIAGGKGVEDGTSFTFDRHFVCNDQSPVALPNGAVEQRHVIATGLSNGHHVVKLSAAPDAPAISEARAYRPPWK